MFKAIHLHSIVEKVRYRSDELAKPRYQEAARLLKHGYKVYSQNDEDGIIAEIFKRIGTTSKTFVEFGVERGVECNTLWLLTQGWSGLWLEGQSGHCSAIAKSHAHFIADGKLQVENAFITAENINALLGRRFDVAQKQEIDLLSVDIDFNDYWVWKAISGVNPRVVCVEYNASWPPPVAITVPYDPKRVWKGGNYCGASLSAMAKLGAEKGYSLVGCCFNGVNAFFVRNDLLGNLFHNPGDAADHYEPARYYLLDLPNGHPTAVGPVVQV